MNKTDLELWDLICSGNADAWEILVNRYQALVYAVPVRAGLRLADCADCFQQTWVALFENRKKIKDPGRLSAWLVTTAKRETYRKLRQSIVAKDTDNYESIDPDPLPDEQLMQIEQQAHLELAIEQLDSRCKKVLEAFFFAPEKLSYDQIAIKLGISPNSLGAIRQRCLHRVKNILEELGYIDVRKENL